MELLIKKTRYTFDTKLYRNINQHEINEQVYANAIQLTKRIPYHKILVPITYIDLNTIPECAVITLFSSKDDYIQFPMYNISNKHGSIKHQIQQINPEISLGSSAFGVNENYEIERVGFYIYNLDANVSFDYEVFEK
jgi:hypothetical protein